MQTSMNREDWKENPGDEQSRRLIRGNDTHAEKRRLFPLSVRVKANSKMYADAKEGTVFMYARTKMHPASFPIEVLAFANQGGYRIMMCFTPGEVDILGPQD